MRSTTLTNIISALADAEGVEPHRLDTVLHRHICTDAIQALEQHESDAWRLRFETPNHVVEVTGNDTILVDGEHIQPHPES